MFAETTERHAFLKSPRLFICPFPRSSASSNGSCRSVVVQLQLATCVHSGTRQPTPARAPTPPQAAARHRWRATPLETQERAEASPRIAPAESRTGDKSTVHSDT